MEYYNVFEVTGPGNVKYFTKENSHKSYEDLKNELRRYYEDTCDYNIKSLFEYMSYHHSILVDDKENETEIDLTDFLDDVIEENRRDEQNEQFYGSYEDQVRQTYYDSR